MAVKTDLDELVEVAFIDLEGTRHEKVKLPRRLIARGTHRARQDWLIQDKQIPDPSAPPPPAPVEVVVEEVKREQEVAIGSAVESLRAQFDELQSKLDQQPLSHAELVSARQEFGAFLVKAADANSQLTQVEGRGSQIKADLQAIAEPLIDQSVEIQRRQDENETVQERVLGDLQAQASETLSTVAAQAAEVRTEAINNSVSSSLAKAIPAAEKAAREVCASHWGSSVTICPESPEDVDKTSWAKRWYGRDQLIEGDGVFVTAKDSITAFRYAGGQWLKSAALNPKTVVGTGPTILDQSTKQNTTMTIVRAGGGGGAASGEALLVNRMGIGGSTVLADSSNWAGIHDPLSGVLELDLRALDGTMQARSAVCIAAFTWDGASADKWTEYALLGDLAGVVQVNLSIQRGNASLPAAGGLMPITIPVGSQAIRIFATVQYVPGAGTGGVTQFSLRGSVSWNFESDGRPMDATQSGKQPLWVWS